ncbi:Thivi_2564 family membrane protein [Paludibacter propionicigenes]|jgi:hypothetical protein|uniref:Thivi_2564 family membrane protein n=1 Tax=Paludibacter propionicigenes TaxID=185300 RepID=UPI001494C7C8|nr:Thivi_2564 family membrane protein [Paludibacter propionicigenes]
MSQLNIFISVSAFIIILWAINTLMPISSYARRIISVVVVIVAIISFLKYNDIIFR